MVIGDTGWEGAKLALLERNTQTDALLGGPDCHHPSEDRRDDLGNRVDQLHNLILCGIALFVVGT